MKQNIVRGLQQDQVPHVLWTRTLTVGFMSVRIEVRTNIKGGRKFLAGEPGCHVLLT